MTFTAADPISLALFLVLMLTILVMAYSALTKAGFSPARVSVAMVLWCGFFSALSQGPALLLPVMMASMVIGALAISLSKVGARVADTTPTFLLVAFQGFRFPLEMLLHQWAGQGVVPFTMTWSGQNFDIVTGVAALLLAPLAARSSRTAWVFNILGIILLANVLRVAVMSSALPFSWPDVHPPLQLAFHFPYVLILPVAVASALGGHVVLTRKLLRTARSAGQS
jgi:hypothetical protein